MAELTPKYEHLLLSGDHNADLSTDKPESRQVQDMHTSLNLNILQLQPTHNRAILDLFVRDEIRVVHHGQLCAPGFFLHDLVFLSYSLKANKYKKKFLAYRNFKSLNVPDLLADADNMSWSDVELMNLVDEKVAKLKKLIFGLDDRHAPMVTRRFTHRPAQWLTPEIRLDEKAG